MASAEKNRFSDTRVTARLGSLGVDPLIAQKSTKLIQFVIENAPEAVEAYKLSRQVSSRGLISPTGVALCAGAMAMGGSSAEVTGAKTVGFVMTELSWTLKLGKAVTMTPGRASAFILVGMGQKALAVAGVVSESEANECALAIAKLTVDVGVTALTWETGIGAYLGVAGAIADAGAVGLACGG